jgi:DNA-binding NtrC family response regulator
LSTILLADDDPIVRKIVAPTLEKAGFNVLVAADGTVALQLAHAHAGEIDVLISDVEMPAVSGLQLAAQLTESRPGMKVLLISAAADISSDLRDGWSFLGKPFSPRVLMEKLAELTSPARESGSPN